MCHSCRIHVRPGPAMLFDFRVFSAVTEPSVILIPVCLHRLPRIGNLHFAYVLLCSLAIDNKKDLPPHVSKLCFFNALLIHTHASPGCSWMLGFFFSPPSAVLLIVVFVFTPELSTIALALPIIIKLLFRFYLIFFAIPVVFFQR